MLGPTRLAIPAADLTSLRPQSELDDFLVVRPNNGQMGEAFSFFQASPRADGEPLIAQAHPLWADKVRE